MSQGKKLVRVADTSTGVLRETAVDEARWNVIHDGLRGCFKAWDSPYSLAADSTEGMAFLASQLAYTEAETYAREYMEMQFRELLPVTSEAGPEAATVRYQVYDKVGQGKRISGAARDVPYSDVAASVVEIGVVTGGAGYRYSQEELVQAARMVRPLPAERMSVAVEMSERHLNSVGLLGEMASVTGQAAFEGLLNYTGVDRIHDTTSGYTAAWATATVDQVLGDVNKAILRYWAASNYTLYPNTYGMAPACFSVLSTRYNALGTKTLLQLVQESNMTTARTGEKLNVIPIMQAATLGTSGAGASGKTRNVLYRNDKKRLVYHVPMPIRFLAPQPEGLDVAVPGWYRYAGVNIRYLYSVQYQDNFA